MKYRHLIFVLLLAALTLFATDCGKVDQPRPEPVGPVLPQVPLKFTADVGELETKAVTNVTMPGTYDKRESFKVFAAFSESPFTAGAGTYENYWDPAGLVCSYNSQYNAWKNDGNYYWPAAGYLSFRAYSPADGATPAFSWQSGFTWDDFVVPVAGAQYDLLYTDLVKDCQRSQYTLTDGDAYDDDDDYIYRYNGINLAFKHALSLVEVQAVSALGSTSSVKYFLQEVCLKKIYRQGDFSSSSPGSWTGHQTLVDYAIVTGATWQQVPGADEDPASVNPALTLMLLPQELNRDRSDTLDETDAYLEVIYKEGETGEPQTVKLPLTEPWEPGKKYIYRLVFSNYIEFNAYISPWGPETVGSHTIII